MISRAIMVAALLGLISSQSLAKNYAVVCDGNEQTTNTDPRAGKVGVKTGPLRYRQTYVIDDTGRTVKHALPPQRRFENVCQFAHAQPTVAISAGVIQVDSSAVIIKPTPTKCHFTFDPSTQKAEWSLRAEDEKYLWEWKWVMTCRKATIPVFNRTERGS